MTTSRNTGHPKSPLQSPRSLCSSHPHRVPPPAARPVQPISADPAWLPSGVTRCGPLGTGSEDRDAVRTLTGRESSSLPSARAASDLKSSRTAKPAAVSGTRRHGDAPPNGNPGPATHGHTRPLDATDPLSLAKISAKRKLEHPGISELPAPNSQAAASSTGSVSAEVSESSADQGLPEPPGRYIHLIATLPCGSDRSGSPGQRAANSSEVLVAQREAANEYRKFSPIET